MTRPWTSSWFTAIQPISFRSTSFVPIGHRTFLAAHLHSHRHPLISVSLRIWGLVMPEGTQVHQRHFCWLSKFAESWRLIASGSEEEEFDGGAAKYSS